MPSVLVRRPSPRLADGELTHLDRVPVDAELAQQQWRGYVDAWRGLGWTPQHSFDAGGLEETVEWYRENREWWEPIKSGDYKRYYEQQYAARLA